MKILAVDTSCDETSVAVVENDWILANKVSTQIELHKKWGGVVPNIAKRAHQENIEIVIKDALRQAGVKLEEIDCFAATRGPGLAIALEIGLKRFIDLAKEYGKPFISVNHMEGHIYSTLAKNSKGNPRKDYSFPLVALLISGGHTEIVLMRDHGQYEIVGQTLDDAVGEAFDKVAKMLDLGYPGGPVIEELAKQGNPDRYSLPIPMQYSKDANMSYSGLKTAVSKLVQEELHSGKAVDARQVTCDIAASFQKTAVDALLIKLAWGLKTTKESVLIKDIIVGGGVANNLYVRKMIRKRFGKEHRLHFPIDKKLYGDNAGMIGVAAYFNALHGKIEDDLDEIDRDPNWSLDEV